MSGTNYGHGEAMTGDENKRWIVTIAYLDGAVVRYIDELGELPIIVERGPDWSTIRDIRIVLARRPA